MRMVIGFGVLVLLGAPGCTVTLDGGSELPRCCCYYDGSCHYDDLSCVGDPRGCSNGQNWPGPQDAGNDD